MGFWDDIKRVGTAVGTGGLSETDPNVIVGRRLNDNRQARNAANEVASNRQHQDYINMRNAVADRGYDVSNWDNNDYGGANYKTLQDLFFDIQRADKSGISDAEFYKKAPKDPSLVDPRTYSPDKAAMFQSTNQMMDYAKGTGASPWLTMAQNDLSGDVSSGQQSAAARTKGRFGGLMQNIAATGGLDTGAQSRLGNKAEEQATLASQGVAGTGLLQRENLNVEDQAQRQQALGQIPSLEQQKFGFEKSLIDMDQKAADKLAEQQNRLKKEKMAQYGAEQLGYNYKDIYG